MPAKDLYHDCVPNALIKDGWTITHDPYRVRIEERDAYINLAAERPFAAEKGDERIAVEVKSFIGPSELRDFEVALGQYCFYKCLIEKDDPGRSMFLAVTDIAYTNTFQRPIVRVALDRIPIPLIVFRPSQERILQWIV